MSRERCQPWTLHALFERCARDSPQRIALEFQGQSVSYGELNRRANRLAHHLREASGVGVDDRVAVLVRHPPTTVVAMLAVLKAGGAYIALDSDNPPALTQRILNDAAPRAVLLDSASARGLTYFGGELFVTDVMGDALETPDTDPEPLATAADLAYVIYTSGTTGAPKGVAVEHRAIVNTVAWRNRYYGFGPDDVTLAIARPSFDSSVEDVFCTLTAGGRLLLPPRDGVTDRRLLAELISRHDVAHFLITPALYKRLLPGLDAAAAAALRAVTIAGEWFTVGLVREHYRRLPHVRLYNEYGPAENAVCSTVHPLAASDESVLIGRPIDNTEAFVVGEDGEPVAPGGVGELCLAGAGLARGYLGNPELTAERFPARRSPGGRTRFYRSGDIVRLHDGGDLEFVGRRDRQVKIRGRRVELGQVAECLARDRSVDDVYVLYYDAPPAPRLIAFVVGPTAAHAAQLRASAGDRLPGYMCPAAVVPVDAIPVTANGKVDEEALLRIHLAIAAGGAPDAAAASPAEADLLVIWRRMFPNAGVGLDDDFFHLGGDSLAVMDLAAVVDEELGVRVDIRELYSERTVRSLARLIENRSSLVMESS
ncbi:MAG TPA: non-ribosomal peptide synthetase [Actinocrinis sp.]